jgi:hypothetical protein
MTTAKAAFIFFALLNTGILSSQDLDKKRSKLEVSTLAEEDILKKRLSEAKALLMDGREDAAESRIEKEMLSATQTADWHLEKAADFLRVAISAQLAGDTKTTASAVRRTLAQLDKAEALSKDDVTALAGIAELRGFIRERLLGTNEEALSEYKKVLVLKPDSASARLRLKNLDDKSAVSTSLDANSVAK